MTAYTLEIIPGTLRFVLDELRDKYSNVVVTSVGSDSVEFESSIERIESFVNIKSALRIKKENGLQKNLFRRAWRKKTWPAGINPALAYIMCSIAEIDTTDIVFDPFCGGGTIALTAANEFAPKKVLASDVKGTAVDMTIENVKSSRLSKEKITVFRSNVSQLKLKKNSVSKVVSNMPFGVRSNDHSQNIKTYAHFAHQMERIIDSNELLVLLTQEKELLRSTMSKKNFILKEELVVNQGGLKPTIFVYKSK